MAKNEPGTSSPSAKSCFGDHRRGFLVIHMRVRIFLFELAQRLDAMVGKIIK